MTTRSRADLSPDKPIRAGGRLERVLRSGRFAVTAELAPADTSDPQAIYERVLVLSEVADANNVTDASGAHVHMSSLGASALLVRAGYEPVLQINCRDRNRIAIQRSPGSCRAWYQECPLYHWRRC